VTSGERVRSRDRGCGRGADEHDCRFAVVVVEKVVNEKRRVREEKRGEIRTRESFAAAGGDATRAS